ncbi:hypothetical protein ACLOJK_014780 [Asimina triloba]
MIFGAPPEHQYSAPSSSPKPAAMAAGGELPGTMAVEPITPMLDLARSRTTPATVPCQQVNIDLHSLPLSSVDPTKNSQIWPSTPKPCTISLHPPSASSRLVDLPVTCQQPINVFSRPAPIAARSNDRRDRVPNSIQGSSSLVASAHPVDLDPSTNVFRDPCKAAKQFQTDDGR